MEVRLDARPIKHKTTIITKAITKAEPRQSEFLGTPIEPMCPPFSPLRGLNLKLFLMAQIRRYLINDSPIHREEALCRGQFRCVYPATNSDISNGCPANECDDRSRRDHGADDKVAIAAG